MIYNTKKNKTYLTHLIIHIVYTTRITLEYQHRTSIQRIFEDYFDMCFHPMSTNYIFLREPSSPGLF